MAREVRVAILGDARDFSRAVRQVQDDAGRLDGTFKGIKRLAGNIEDLTEVFEHPALDLLDNVTAWDEGFGFRESLYADLDMFGRSFTNIIAPGVVAPPVALWRMLPHLMKIVPSQRATTRQASWLLRKR